ncbi:hypothetical protein [Peribacillus frigoritolerans]|uniref:hypothetical protein n=1 Tax=Peribacillus frigoritolerans TaxID=450367 RepID=UPI000FD8A4CE|nr:hypothetical protein [Peribacillus frigoritolerans]AZV60312.1 hypothetical protein DOZ91_06525 [Peribacillus frigoritolerans]
MGNTDNANNQSQENVNKERRSTSTYNKEYRNRLNSFFDATVLLTFLTVFCYFLAQAFQKGQRSFYGIDGLVKTQLDINVLIDSFYAISSLLLKLGLSYFIFKVIIFLVGYFFKNADSKSTRGFISFYSTILLIFFITCVLPFFILGEFNSPLDIVWNLGLLYRFCVLFIVIMFLFIFIPNARHGIEKLLEALEKEGLVTFLWTKSKLETKVIFIVFLSFLLGVAFYHYGYTDAEKKENYVIYIDKNNKEYVLLDKDKNTLIVSELLKGKKGYFVKKEELKIIQLKSDEYNFNNQEFKNGLQFQPNKRAEKLKVFLPLWNDILKNSILYK